MGVRVAPVRGALSRGIPWELRLAYYIVIIIIVIIIITITCERDSVLSCWGEKDIVDGTIQYVFTV